MCVWREREREAMKEKKDENRIKGAPALIYARSMPPHHYRCCASLSISLSLSAVRVASPRLAASNRVGCCCCCCSCDDLLVVRFLLSRSSQCRSNSDRDRKSTSRACSSDACWCTHSLTHSLASRKESRKEREARAAQDAKIKEEFWWVLPGLGIVLVRERRLTATSAVAGAAVVACELTPRWMWLSVWVCVARDCIRSADVGHHGHGARTGEAGVSECRTRLPLCLYHQTNALSLPLSATLQA